MRRVARGYQQLAALSAGVMNTFSTGGLFSATVPSLCPAKPSAAPATAEAAGSALDIAMRVNKLKRLHQTGGSANTSKKQLEFTAWKELNTLSDDQINQAEGKVVALLLNSWAYFAKFWEKGKDGPYGTEGAAAATETK